MAGRHSAAVIGAGSQGWVHAHGYREVPDLELTTVVDVDPSAAASLAVEFGASNVSTSYAEAFETATPDIVSVCTPPAFHLEVVRAAVRAGVRAIHCEKPLALSYADALEMVSIAEEADVQLTFNLQRRFDPVHRFVRDRIRSGAIGEVVSIEGYCPNLADWGTHIVDLAFFYLDDAPVSWVMGQLDVSTNRYVYGAFAETSSVTLARFVTGVNLFVFTGREPRTPLLNRQNQLGLIVQGTEGRIESRGERAVLRRFGAPEEIFPNPLPVDQASWDRGIDPTVIDSTASAIRDAVAALDSAGEPVLGARRGLAGAEVIFATYESSRARRRVEIPLEVHDNALLAGLDAGFWSPVGELRSTY